MKVVVINGASGVALTAATDRIRRFLTAPPGGRHPALTVAVEDVESELCALYAADHPKETLPSISPMEHILFRLPRDSVTRYYWPLAARSAFRKLLLSRVDVRILRGHLTYYRGATSEYYDAGDLCKALGEARSELMATNSGIKDAPWKDANISEVITLIDDIFDMFHRLAVEGQVFPLKDSILEEYRRRALEGREAPSAADQQYVLAFEQVVTILHRLLEWRSREMTSGDALAGRCAAEHFVLGTKHATETAASLVRLGMGDSSWLPVYLSHPISRPRKQQKAHPQKEWGKFVNELQTLAEVAGGVQASGKRPLFFLPTAIDEFRFADRTNPAFPTLERRWPIIEDRDGLLYETPQAQEYELFESECLLEEIFNPIGGVCDCESEELSRLAASHDEVPSKLSDRAKDAIEALIGGLLQQIKIQLAIRDHAIVRQCGRLLLYRPLYEEGRLSGGVGAELRNWATLVQTSKEFGALGRPVTWRRGRAIFVHDSKDLAKVDESNSRKLQPDVVSRLQRSLTAEQLALFDFDAMSGPPHTWFAQALKGGDPLLGGSRASRTETRLLHDLFNSTLEEAQKAVQRLSRVGGEPLEWTDYFVYERLAEVRHLRFEGLAREQILPALFGSL